MCSVFNVKTRNSLLICPPCSPARSVEMRQTYIFAVSWLASAITAVPSTPVRGLDVHLNIEPSSNHTVEGRATTTTTIEMMEDRLCNVVPKTHFIYHSEGIYSYGCYRVPNGFTARSVYAFSKWVFPCFSIRSPAFG